MLAQIQYQTQYETPRARAADAIGFEASLYALVEAELGSGRVTRLALTCASSSELSSQWSYLLDRTARHLDIACELLRRLDLDPNTESLSRIPLRANTEGLLRAIRRAQHAAAVSHEVQLTAAQCVVEAILSARCSWELIPVVAESCNWGDRAALLNAQREVDIEKSHLIQATARCTRELWLRSLGRAVRQRT